MKTLWFSLTIAAGLTAFAAVIYASDFVKPTIENLPVFSADGTKIGVLRTITPLRKLKETPQMLMIEYSDDRIYFIGWAAKSYLAQCDTPKAIEAVSSTKPSTVIPGAVPLSEKEAKETPKQRLTTSETKKNLRSILKVPVNYIQQTEINKLQNMEAKSKVSSSAQSKVYMRINPEDKNSDGYAEITVLLQFERDSIVSYFVDEKIASLEDFKSQAAQEYGQVIDFYIQALNKYKEDLRGNFISLCNRAEKSESLIK
jgi:hypothetical protein